MFAADDNAVPHDDPTPSASETTGTPRFHRLLEINSDQLLELAHAGAVVILPISPIEEHGPHLPMGTDAMLADHFAVLSAEIVAEKEPGTPVVIAPLIPVGTHVYKFMGSIYIRQRAIRNLLIDYGRSLARAGFTRLIIVSSHGGPKHMVALDEAATSLTRFHRLQTISLTSKIIFKFLSGTLVERISAACDRPLTEEERNALSMDYHAGWWETAMMLFLRPELVKDGYEQLPDALVPRWKLRPGTPLRPPAGMGYLGAPGRADASFARASLVVLREEAASLIGRFLAGKTNLRHFRSPLYRLPMLRTNFKYWVLGLIVVILILIRIFAQLLMTN